MYLSNIMVLLWDASALAQGYTLSRGSATVDALLALNIKHVSTSAVYAETANVIRRNRNAGVMSQKRFQVARADLKRDTSQNPNFLLLPSIDIYEVSIPLADAHNLNTADAALLYIFLRYSQTVGEPCVVVASDNRLLRAAEGEGLSSLDPQVVPPDDVESHLPLTVE